ncbi:Fic family protein [soil metagenome]
MSDYKIPKLPLDRDLESKEVLKKVAAARSALAEVKGAATSIPNEGILIDTLSLQEAKDSSAIENIITTHDELYQSDALAKSFKSVASKEVYAYASALKAGHVEVVNRGFLTSNQIIDIQAILEENDAGFRKLPGTDLRNEQTGEVVYTPPQTNEEIVELMNNLEQFMNDASLSDLDPLVKRAIIHHQFESIHPFYDGNGRTGRIVNILYLVKEGLLQIPILYLSRYINRNKAEYYRLLQAVRTTDEWEAFILYMLTAVEETSHLTIEQIVGIKTLMQNFKVKMRSDLPKIYSQDRLNNIFRHPYTKIDFVMKDLGVSRPTATRYLDELIAIGLLEKHKLGKENFYINKRLFNLLANNQGGRG